MPVTLSACRGAGQPFPFADVNLTKQDAPKKKLFALHDLLGIEHL